MSEIIRKPAAGQDTTADNSTGEPTSKADRRMAPRRRVLKGAKATFQDRHCSIPCMVRDISNSGARIKSPNCQSIPDRFELIIELDGLEAKCEAIWRRDDEMGVRFLDPPSKVTPKRQQVVAALVPAARPSLRRTK